MHLFDCTFTASSMFLGGFVCLYFCLFVCFLVFVSLVFFHFRGNFLYHRDQKEPDCHIQSQLPQMTVG